jgi:hypothetical protein
MKLTNFKMMRQLEFIGICGPTYDDQDITPFQWSKADFGNTTNHYGHPDLFMFEPFYVKWQF